MQDYIFAIDRKSAEAFGELVKTWSKNPDAAPVGSHSLEDFMVLLEKADVKATPPSREGFEIERVEITMAKLGVLEIRIPAKEMTEASEAYLADHDYPMPAYAFNLFRGEPPEVTDKMKVHRERVADYVILHCA